MRTVSLATQQARSLAEASPDRDGSMTDALVRLVQEKIFGVLVEAEDVEEGQLARIARVVADLGRATISQKRWAEEMRGRLEKQKNAASAKIDEIKLSGGLSGEAYDAIRAVLLGIDPMSKESAKAFDGTGHYLR